MDIRELDLASKGKRFVAFIIDNFPITFLIALVYFNFYGFEEVYIAYMEDPTDTEARAAFLKLRNQVRDISFFLYLAYCILMEGSELQATIGKRLMKIKVIHESGEPLSMVQSLNRNISKIISSVVFSMGFIWILFDRKHQGWHDKIAKTYVVNEAFSSSRTIKTPVQKIDAPVNFYSIGDGNQFSVLYEPVVDKKWMEQLEKNPQTNFVEKDHKLNDYISKLLEEVIRDHDIPDYALLWNNFTRGQKAIWTFSLFNTDTSRDGIVLFLKNWPEFIFAAQEIWIEFGIEKLSKNYDNLIKELFEDIDDISLFKESICQKDPGWQSKWLMISAQFDLLDSSEVIDGYYNTSEFKEELFEAISKYIEDHRDQFL